MSRFLYIPIAEKSEVFIFLLKLSHKSVKLKQCCNEILEENANVPIFQMGLRWQSGNTLASHL